MIRPILLAAALALPGLALAAEGEQQITDYDFSFEGPFGSYDQLQLQRGLQVYTDVCASCHGLKYVALRTLADPGGPELPEDQVRAYAEFYEVFDPEIDDFRPAIPTDHFPESQFEGAPDLSLLAKGRAGFHGPYGLGLNQLFKGMGGAEYVTSVLTHYTGEEKEEAGVILYENTAYPGGWIAMPPPLYGDDVVYEDGSDTSLDAIAQDVGAFLMWTAEPKMMARKHAGLTGVIFLGVLAVLLWLTNKRIWAPVKDVAKGRRSDARAPQTGPADGRRGERRDTPAE